MTRRHVRGSVALHARPASLVVQAVSEFAAEISIAFGEREANAKSILSLLSLGIEAGDSMVICAKGEDAAAALEAVEQIISGG
jgi:phosphotransferase system HPr (HPr) family protein